MSESNSRRRHAASESGLAAVRSAAETSGEASAIEGYSLNERLISVLEAEREKIAREMHDEAGQLLVSAGFRLDQAIAMLPKAFAGLELLEQSREALDECAEALHRLAFNLRPRMLDDLGLLPALQSYLKRYANLVDVKLELRIEKPQCKIDPAIELSIFRIVQEAVANIRKHAGATAVVVQLTFSDQRAELTISDDGVGFDPDSVKLGKDGRPKLGLLGMRERVVALGGDFRIESRHFFGTRIIATLPLNCAAESAAP